MKNKTTAQLKKPVNILAVFVALVDESVRNGGLLPSDAEQRILKSLRK